MCVARNCVPERIPFPSISCLLVSSTSDPCYTSIYFTVSLSSDEMRPALSFPFRFPSVELLSGVITYLHLFSASPSSATRSPDSSHFSSNPCPATILFILSIICLRSSTSPTSLATSLYQQTHKCPTHLRPGVGAPRDVEIHPSAAGPTYKMTAGYASFITTMVQSPHPCWYSPR